MENINIESSAVIIGKVALGENANIAQGTIIRSESGSVSMGNSSWALENSVIIGTPQHPVKVGAKTVFGHKCTVIGAEIGNLCEVGNSAIFLPGCKVGDMCMFGEGTIIPSDMVIPSGSVVVGRPGRIIRKLTQADKATIKRMRGGDTSLSEYAPNIINREAEMKNIYKCKEKFPKIADSVHIFSSAEITGDVTIGENSVIGAGVKIIGDSHGPVIIGDNVQILENTVLHLLPDNQLVLHNNVTIGPNCMIHGTVIGENSVVESGAIVCDNSILGKNTRVLSGSLVKQRDEFKDNAIIEGFPARQIGENTETQSRPDWAVRQLV